jgi:hypothetical protein
MGRWGDREMGGQGDKGDQLLPLASCLLPPAYTPPPTPYSLK